MNDSPSVARRLVVGEKHFPRLDRFLSEELKELGISREKIKQAILAGRVTVNGVPVLSPKRPVCSGDKVEADIAPPPSALQAEAGDLCVLHRDETLVVLDKPAGLTVHPCPSCPTGTLAHRLLAHFPELAAQEGLRPGIVHRLDKDTSGLLLAALTEKARLALSRAFAAREIRKEYLALAGGVPVRHTGEIHLPLGRDPQRRTKMAVLDISRGGREARSAYRVLHADPAGRFCLLAVRIFTGRTHQIRVHLAASGHPIIGDALYGGASPAAKRQLLHAWKLDFSHPESGESLSFTRPPPRDLAEAARVLSRALTPLVITGSPGCGKSALLAALAESGLPVWSADACVRELYAKGHDGWSLVQRRFGGRFMRNASAVLDKKALFEAMRGDEGIRREVEHLIHPLVQADLARFWEQCARDFAAGKSPSPLAVAEVPLYLEAGWCGAARPEQTPRSPAPLLAGVFCPAERRMERLRQRGWDEAAIAAMESWQWPPEQKLRACGLVVDNSGSLDELQKKALALRRVLERITERKERELLEYLGTLWA
jgi:23S rRNA pseudouridine1911/1915/1917 synthase